MANIFLSYARDDAAKAGRIANALEAAGHSVWWDRHIGAGSRFSAEIEEALQAAELVVVLWSKQSVRSAWVQDEAAAGRDSGRLVPVLLDKIEPPLGFRQYQAVTLSGGLASSRSIQPLVDAIAAKVAEPETTAPRVRVRQRTSWRMPALVASLVLLVLMGAWLLFLRPSGGQSHVVAVAAAEGGDQRRSQDLARTVATDLGRFRGGPLGALTIIGGAHDASYADYRVEVSVSDSGAELQIGVSLLSPRDSEILWTTTEQGPESGFVDLRQRAVAKLGDVLACAVEVSANGEKLSVDVLGLYLNGCGRRSDLQISVPDQEVLSIFRQVTIKAPNFAPGWANLALLEVQSFPGTPPPDRKALREAVVAHLARAKQLNPTLPETIAADAYFHPNDGTKPAHALAVLDRGLERQPDSASLQHMRAIFLADVGRLNEAVTAAQRAMQLNPLSPAIRDTYISGLAYGGRVDAAFAELAKAEAIWPESTVLDQLRYRLDLRYGDPKAALLQLRKRGGGDVRPAPMDTAWQGFIEARIDPSPARIETALDAFRDRYRRDPADIPGYLQALGTFGRVDEAFEAVKPAKTLDSIMSGTEALFRVHMRSIRSDPRFVKLAGKLGLVAYWQNTNVWPDFCSEPQLSYDCRKEAAKLTPEQRKPAQFLPSA